jgi:hypothetical protein
MERIPAGVWVAVCAVAVAVAAAATIRHETDGEAPRAAQSRQEPYLGSAGAGRDWMPSRASPRSVVWAVGDGADGSAEGQEVAEMVAANRVDRLLYLGDVYDSGTEAEFSANYRPLFGRFDGVTAPEIGNHEWPNVATGYVPYWSSVRGSPPPLWYSFAVSGWQLLGLNSNSPSDTSPRQLAWLRRTIRRTPRYGDCRIAFMHHPRYSAGLHGDTDELDGLTDELSGHATLLVAGHDHDMERLRPVGGLTQLVAGSGGAELYPANEADGRLAFSDDTHHGALRLALRPGRAILSFVAVDGTVLDRSAVSCTQE